jgi:hypothetical protein
VVLVPERPAKVSMAMLLISCRLLLLLVVLVGPVQDGAQPRARPAAVEVTRAARPPVLLRQPPLSALDVRH